MKKREFFSPIDTETAFYSAFERADADAMREVWDTGKDIECIHPLGHRMRGEEVHAGWREVFAKANPIAFHLSDRRSFEQNGLTVHVVLENILFQDAKAEPLQVLSTNVYRRGESGWRMVMRHSSPVPFTPRSQPGNAIH